MRETVAVVGAGVSGLTAAYLLSQRYDVTLYEAEPRLGGHAHTHDITDPAGRRLAIDTGFIVHNDRTYPLLRRLFTELGVRTQPTEMSMSISDPASGLEFAGGRGMTGIFAQGRRLTDPRFLRLLTEVRRFHRRAAAYVERTYDDLATFGEFLEAEHFSPAFIRLYAVPVVSCVWSCGGGSALSYPARYLFRFLEHHGMLSISGSPQWLTVTGGSRQYVDAVADRLDAVRTGLAIQAIHRHPDGVAVTVADGNTMDFDRVVLATHADQALDLLADATPGEKAVLGSFEYSQNETVLHTDTSLLPATKNARGCWNYVVRSADAPLTTYWMNRLQGLETDETYLVTLNGADVVDPAKVIARMDYEHPIYTPEAVAAQSRLATLNTRRITFAGAYHGWGFHEDGCRAGVAAAGSFGVRW